MKMCRCCHLCTSLFPHKRAAGEGSGVTMVRIHGSPYQYLLDAAIEKRKQGAILKKKKQIQKPK